MGYNLVLRFFFIYKVLQNITNEQLYYKFVTDIHLNTSP